MEKNKNKFIKKAVLIAFSGIFISSVAVGGQDGTSLTPLTVISADDATLRSLNCDPAVMKRLNDEYILKRGRDRTIELKTLVQEQVNNTPSPSSSGADGSCFEKAAKNISGVVDTYNNVVAILSGSVNPGPLIQKAADQAMDMACKEIDNSTGNATQGLNGASQAYNGATQSVNGFKIGNNGVALTGGDVLANMRETKNAQNNGAVSQNASCSSLGNCSINPFK